MRIQNEGTGKSSWWVINPDAKPGKTPRRRATSMETKAYKERRGRVKKKVEAMRAAILEGHGSPVSATDDYEYLSESPIPGFQLSPEFRQRADSNASSCGRFSPAFETDMHDTQVPPMSPIPCITEMEGDYSGDADFSATQDADQLVDILGESMKLCDNLGLAFDPLDPNVQQLLQQSNGYNRPNGQLGSSPPFGPQFSNLPAPPPYPEQLRRSPQSVPTNVDMMQSNLYNSSRQPAIDAYSTDLFTQDVTLNKDMLMSFPDAKTQISMQGQYSPSRSPQMLRKQDYISSSSSPNYSNHSPQMLRHSKPISPQLSPQLSRSHTSPQHTQQRFQANSLLRAALTQRSQLSPQPPHQLSPQGSHHTPQLSPQGPNISPQLSPQSSHRAPKGSHLGSTQLSPQPSQLSPQQQTFTQFEGRGSSDYENTVGSSSSVASLLRGPSQNASLVGKGIASQQVQPGPCLLAHSNPAAFNNSTASSDSGIPTDIDFDTFQNLDMGSDNIMDQVIQELSLEGNLDFNFDTLSTANPNDRMVH